ncbi:MAG: septal ring lytic transglycosylase RlpA family protein [Alphaproteobacteria bacterium]|nr:septal ring lytic transglycosylase RlpA family protein [Alphaproteobacteria bacterium SS10]
MTLSACAEATLVTHMAKQMPVDLGPEVEALGNLAHPHRGGHYKVGLPYTIKGITYRPKVDYDYDEVGIASWYGPGFDGKLTANGEIYDQDLLTAAHKTLPMPSLARVINLENGRSVVVRINDRGPFAPGRIIDMSDRGARLLGFHQQGITKVRVQILAEESKILAAAAQGKPVPRYTGMVLSKAAPGLDAPPVPKAKPSLEPVLAVAQPVPNPVPSARALLANWPGQDQANSGALYIQLAAFRDPVRADAARQSIGHLGPAGVYRADLSLGTFYRLRLGPLSDRDQADRLLAQVLRAGYPGARIIAD